MPQAPSAHTAWPLLTVWHWVPHLPQLVRSVPMLVSQPSMAPLRQSCIGAVHTTIVMLAQRAGSVAGSQVVLPVVLLWHAASRLRQQLITK